MFDELDFVYLPSRDVAGDLKHFQRIALYQLTPPEAPARLAGRRDF